MTTHPPQAAPGHAAPGAERASELQGIARFKIHDGKLEEFKRLNALCTEIVWMQDTGTLQFETYFSSDRSECMIIERFRDSEALMEHFEHVGDLMAEIMETGSLSGELLGEPNAELRAQLTDGGVRIFGPARS